MNWQTRLIQRCLSGIVILGISSILVLTWAGHADAAWYDFLFPGRNRRQAGGGTSEGASIRDDGCYTPSGHRVLKALVPPDATGATLQGHPTFLFYLPFGRSQRVTQAEFMLLDAQQNYAIARPIRVMLPETGGLVRFTLPETATPLAPNQRYNWYFSIICDAEEPSRNPSVSGWIQRTVADANLALELQTAPKLLRYRVYGEGGIWYDTLASLADQYQDQTIQPLWSRILATYDLEDVTQQAVPELKPVNASTLSQGE